MPKMSFSKESLEGKAPVPDGAYQVRLEGFEPKASKSGTSTNLNPILKIVNHHEHSGTRIYDNLNSSAGWIIESFCHSFGLTLVPDGNGGFTIPGDFVGPDDDPSKWQYNGPLTGLIANVLTKQTEYNGRTNAKIDKWICSVPSCSQKHPSNLAS